MPKSIIFAAVAVTLVFTSTAFAEKRSQAQIEHDKFCSSLKATYDAVLLRNMTVKAGRKGNLHLYNIKLLGEANNCSWAM